MADLSVTHRNLLRGTIAIAVATVIFYMGSVNWSAALSQGRLNSALFTYLLAVAFALSPYGILVSLLERAKRSTVFQIALFSLVVALPVISFSTSRISHINTGGWDYFVIPFWQLVLLMVLNGLCEIFVPLTESHKLEQPGPKNDS